MKTKQLSILLFTLLLATNVVAQTVSEKRGFCGDLFDQNDLDAVVSSGWYYNWGQSAQSIIDDTVKNYINYMPMAWGASYNRNALVEYLTNHPEIEYLLGFNEPNFLEQANLTPSEAAALWPELEAIADQFNLKLVSPAVNFCYSGGSVIENNIEYLDPVQYLDDFFAALPDSSRVDYVAIHAYFDNTGALPWYISLFEKYGKPLWITEFNHSDGNNTTESSQQDFMVEAVDYFEKEPLVFRYAWLLTRNDNQLNTNLFENNTTGELTDLGLIYENMSSYDSTYFHETESQIEAEHYTDMDGIHLLVTEDSTGILAVDDFDDDDWMTYNLQVDSTADYAMRIRITSVWESSFSLYCDDSLLTTYNTPITETLGTWETIAYPDSLNLTEGNHEIKIVLHYGGWQFNWFQIIPVENINEDEIISNDDETGVSNIENTFRIYPNPTSNYLIINSTEEQYDCKIYSLSGNLVFSEENCSNNQELDIANLQQGIYILKIESDKINSVKKIRVE